MQQAAASQASGGNTPGAYYAQGNSGFGSNQYDFQWRSNPPLRSFSAIAGAGGRGKRWRSAARRAVPQQLAGGDQRCSPILAR